MARRTRPESRSLLAASGWRHVLALTFVWLLGCQGGGPTDDPEPKTASASTSPKPLAIAAGTSHTCVVRESGKIACWGRNDQGQLGDGTLTDRSTPVEVVNIGDAVEVVLGTAHTCARRRTGAVLCWGNNARGQLGNGDGGPGKGSRRPASVRGLTDASALASGDDHVCALRAGAPMVCWGDNRDGQLGNASQSTWLEPVPLRSIVDATALAAGARHTCALRGGGKVICWGANADGQLGDGNNQAHERATVVEGVPALSAIAAAGSRTCGVGNGGAFCWGELDDRSLLRPERVAEGSTNDPITQIEVGPEHTCVRHRGGRLSCFGRNVDGRVGTGNLGPQREPTPVELAGSVVDVALGHRHSCALTNEGKVWCWGDDANGALGRGDPQDTDASRSGAREVVSIADAVALDSGDGFSCALQAGEVWCWGRNDSGQLGDGTSQDRAAPAAVEGISDAVALATGEKQVCVARKSGAVACWGANDQGQLGRPAGDPVHKPLPAAKIERAVALSLGVGHACAIQHGGNVICWGSDAEGQLGDGAGSRGGKVANLSDAVALSSGRAHTCALRSSGMVSCWGSNNQGQLGNSVGAAQLKVPAHVPVTVTKLDDAASIHAGPEHSCARTRGGKALCWGRNDQAQLGSGTSSNIWSSRVPVLDLAGVVALDVGWGHACAALPGRLACWGDNAAGQAAFEGTSAPTPRPSLTGLEVAELALGRDHSCARLRAGDVVCWGSNEHGQLGDGGRAVSPRPVEVADL